MTATSTSTDDNSRSHGDTVSRCPVWHIGNLAEDRSTPYLSYEGKGVSVSRHPEAWRDIMQRDGSLMSSDAATYRLEHPDAAFYYVDPVEDLHREREWALTAEFVTKQPGFHVDYETTTGEVGYLQFTDRDTAQREADARDGTATPTSVLQLAERGHRYWETAFRQPPTEANPVVIEGLLPVWYASHHDYDGVWWGEALDPANFSAPRGVVFQAVLDQFDIIEEDD